MKKNNLGEVARGLKSYFEFKGVSANESEDFVQDVFFKVLRAGKDIESIEKAYFFSTANRLMIDYWRKCQRDPLAKISALQIDNELFTGHGYSPEYLYHEDQLLKKFSETINALTQLQRQTFVSHRLGNSSIKEIAEVRAVTVGAVEKLLSKANNRVRMLLIEQAGS